MTFVNIGYWRQWEIDDGDGILEIKNNTKNVVYEAHSHQSSRRSLKFVIYFPVVKLEDQYERKPYHIKSAVIFNIIKKPSPPPSPFNICVLAYLAPPRANANP